MRHESGKTLTIFVVLIIILLASSTSIGFYLYQMEKQWRKSVQTDLDSSRANETKLQGQVKDLQTQLNLALDKNKEAEKTINNLLDEKDLNESLRAALKKENVKLKEDVETINKSKENLRAALDKSNTQLSQSQDLLKAAEDHVNQLDKLKKALEDKLQETTKAMQTKIDTLMANMKAQTAMTQIPSTPTAGASNVEGATNKVQLGKIVVNKEGTKGHILNIDTDAQFVIFNLGAKEGIKSEDVLSVYRGDQYVGDIQATRVQDEMSAADLIPPMTVNQVHKNDTVVLKP